MRRIFVSLILMISFSNFTLINASIAKDIKKKVEENIKSKFSSALEDMPKEIKKLNKAGEKVNDYVGDFTKIVKTDVDAVTSLVKPITGIVSEVKSIFKGGSSKSDLMGMFFDGKLFELIALIDRVVEILDKDLDFRKSIGGLAKLVSMINDLLKKLINLQSNPFGRNRNARRLGRTFFPDSFYKELKKASGILNGIVKDLKSMEKDKPVNMSKLGAEVLESVIDNRDKIFKDSYGFIKSVVMRHLFKIKCTLSGLFRSVEQLKSSSGVFLKYSKKLSKCINKGVSSDLTRDWKAQVITAWSAYFNKDKFVDVVCDNTEMCFRYPGKSLGYVFEDLTHTMYFLGKGLKECSDFLNGLRKINIKTIPKNIPEKMDSIHKRIFKLGVIFNKISGKLK